MEPSSRRADRAPGRCRAGEGFAWRLGLTGRLACCGSSSRHMSGKGHAVPSRTGSLHKRPPGLAAVAADRLSMRIRTSGSAWSDPLLQLYDLEAGFALLLLLAGLGDLLRLVFPRFHGKLRSCGLR